jgi:hypothetical protein
MPMQETVFVRDCDPVAVEGAIRSILEDVQAGKYSKELGVSPPAGLAHGLKIERPQGMSPGEWKEIITVFGPTVAVMTKDIWTIVVVPRLKKLFREDSVSEKNPDHSK